MQGEMPFMCEGEILEVQPRVQGDKNVVRYTCRVYLPNGSSIIVRNAIESTMFGGISDYFRRRARATRDAAQAPGDFEQSSLDATIGERIYISFINGNYLYPVILGWAQHPNQTDEPDVDDGENPNAVFQYLGLRAEVNEEGEIKFIHKGAPEVKYTPVANGLIGQALSAATSLLGGSVIKGNNNPAITPQPDDEVTLWEMLKGGVYRVRDAEGQIIELDRTKQRIYISNNDLKSTQEPGGLGVIGNLLAQNATDAEYVLLDKSKQLLLLNARSILQLYSFDQRKDVTDGNHSHRVAGNSEWQILGDKITTIAGNKDEKIIGNYQQQITGNSDQTILGNWTVDAVGDITLKDKLGGTISISKGKIALTGFTGTDVVDILSQTLMQLSQALGNLGYPLSNAAAFAALQVQLDLIKGV